MYHTIILVGNLGRDPEMRYTPSGQAVTNFSVAASRKYSDANGQLVDETTWFRISCWGKQAESCNQYLKKGNKVLVEGRLAPDPKTGGPRLWQGKNGAGAAYEVTANTVRFLSGRGDNGSGESIGGYVPAVVAADDGGGEIPF
ncbi:MAG: single-stranded DNA-binding protein [Chloroflexota bacterium]